VNVLSIDANVADDADNVDNVDDVDDADDADLAKTLLPTTGKGTMDIDGRAGATCVAVAGGTPANG
jgi:hypothetical protein